MSGGTGELDRTRAMLEEVGFEHIQQILPELIEKGVKDKLALGGFLELVCTAERDFREERRVRTSLKLSGLSMAKTLSSYDFAFHRGVHKGKIELLATCEFAKRRENVLLLGPPGVGKTHLATGLGIRAIENGFSVSFMSADQLVEQLRRDDAAANRRIRRRRYMNASVLIIDELGFQAFDRRDAHLLFKVVSYRYERGSTIITSNKSIREWPDMLAGDDALATAILDRLLHHCHVVQIDGRSFRLREIEQQIGEG
jgi:DNA replication protein DnaC